jgi:hypothetical protein
LLAHNLRLIRKLSIARISASRQEDWPLLPQSRRRWFPFKNWIGRVEAGGNDPSTTSSRTRLRSSVHEREMICDRGSGVRGSMTSPDVRATSRAYVAGPERHKMEEWRTNAASGPRLRASSMTNRLYSSLDETRGSGHSQLHSQASLPAYFLAGRGIGVTPTCSSAVYGAP